MEKNAIEKETKRGRGMGEKGIREGTLIEENKLKNMGRNERGNYEDEGESEKGKKEKTRKEL